MQLSCLGKILIMIFNESWCEKNYETFLKAI